MAGRDSIPARAEQSFAGGPSAVLLLVVVLLTTVLVWVRACQITHVSDDYLLEIHSFAPISSIVDVAKPFTRPAVNTQYWRPVSDGLAVADFLVWGWDGRGFHLTNLIIHLLATLCVFFAVRDIFGRSRLESALVALVFGVSASHEANILWPPGRTDSLATLFVLLAMVFEYRARSRDSGWRAIGVACFLLALGSKEIALASLPIIYLIPSRKGRRRRPLAILPYVAGAAMFVILRGLIAEPISDSGVLAGAGSLPRIAMNTLYAAGYTLLPVDLAQATALLNEHRTAVVAMAVCAAVSGIVFGVWLVRMGKLEKYLLPLAYTIATGVFTMMWFERWRVYMMSVGVFTMAVMAVFDLAGLAKNRFLRVAVLSAISALVLFHAGRSLSAETTWIRASRLRDELQADLGRILEELPERPLKFLFIDRPAKLGSAPVLHLAIRDLLTQAHLQRGESPKLRTGGFRDMTIDSESATLLLALDEERGFRDLRWAMIDRHTYEISAAENPGLEIVPVTAKTPGRAARDQAYEVGDTLRSPFADVIMLETERISARRVVVSVRDSTMVPLLFDGTRFIIPTRTPR